MQQDFSELQESYNQVAEEYTVRISHELEQKPFDRELLTRFANVARDLGMVCEIGCGPGHVAHYLWEQNLHVLGIDLAPGMVEQAQRLYPEIEFQQGNMLELQVEDAAWGSIVAFYSLIHIPRTLLPEVLQEFKRVLKLDGLLLVAFHQGQEIRHWENWWGKKVSVDFIFYERQEMEEYIRQAGFVIEESIERAPYAEIEAQTQRVYIWARKHEN